MNKLGNSKCWMNWVVTGVLLGGSFFLSACSSPRIEPLMETPLVYQLSEVGPLDHLPEEAQWNLRKVYYATTREREADLSRIVYSNKESAEVSIGSALVAFGGYDLSWADLRSASLNAEREKDVPLYISGMMEFGRLQVTPQGEILKSSGPTEFYLREIRESIRASKEKDVLIYVHGAKVDFYNACAFAAQLDHFMGREMTSIAFSWPTRQNIAAYVVGDDVERGQRSVPALASLIRILADNTEADRIHIVCWSAGGRVVTQTLTQLHDSFPDKSPDELRERFRLGQVYFAASDVPRETFITALPKINSLVQKVVVTSSSKDEALQSASLFMGEGPRIGQISDEPLLPEEKATVLAADRLQVVDVSGGHERRGFDITGHRYWIDHPWASTDMLLTIRNDLEPAERGLVPGIFGRIHWTMPPDYPERIQALIDQAPPGLQEGR